MVQHSSPGAIFTGFRTREHQSREKQAKWENMIKKKRKQKKEKQRKTKKTAEPRVELGPFAFTSEQSLALPRGRLRI